MGMLFQSKSSSVHCQNYFVSALAGFEKESLRMESVHVTDNNHNHRANHTERIQTSKGPAIGSIQEFFWIS